MARKIEKPLRTAALETLSDEELSTISGGGAVGFPSESVRLTYGAIEWTYTQQKRADGTAGGNVAAKWSVAQGAAA